MKKILLMLWTASLPLLGAAQTHTVAYHEGTGVNGGSTASINFNYLSTCQQSASVDGSAGIWDGISWSSGSFSVIVNGSNIGTFPSPSTVDLTSYIPITSLQLTSSAGTWHTVDAVLYVTSNSAGAPPEPTAVSSVTYCQGATPAQFSAAMSGSGASLRWYTDQYGSGHTATAPTPNTATVGTYYYGVSQIDASGCESPRHLIQVNVVSAADQSISLAAGMLTCAGATNVVLANSESGVNYYLRNNADNSVIGGPVTGNGSSVNLYTGYTTSTTTYNVVAQSPSGALDFDGVDDYVSLPNFLGAHTQGTIETWVKLDALTREPIFTKQHDFVNTLATFTVGSYSGPTGTTITGTPGVLYFHPRNSAPIAAGLTPLVAGQWTHVAVSYNSTGASLYINGVLDSYTAGDFSVPGDASPDYTAIAYWDLGYLEGTMDETRIWNVARTESEIRAGMYTCMTGMETGLLAYYQYENGVNATTLTDIVAGANGTLTNMNTAQAWVPGSGTCGACSSVMTTTPTLTINPISDQTTSAANTTICPNTSTTVSVGSSENNIAYFLRDNSNNAIVDGPVSGNGSALTFNTGNITATTTYNVYAEGSANGLAFDGVDDVVLTTNAVDLAGKSFSIEAWAKRSSTGTNDYILGQGSASQSTDHNLHFGFRNSNTFTLAFWNDDITSSSAYVDLNWHHWVGTYDAATNTQSLYMDGTLIGTRTATGDYVGSGTMTIGNTPWGGDNFDGNIDEVRVWGYALSAPEVSANMNNCLNGNEDGLILYYNFNQMSGSTVATDITNNGNDGVLTNMDVNAAWQDGVSNCSCTKQMTNTVTVTVQDNVPTVAAAPSNMTVNVDAGVCGAVVNYTAPTFNDDCDGNGLSGTMTTTGTASGATFNVGTTTVSYQYTDASSQSVTASFIVTVVDNEDPVISNNPGDQTIAVNNAGCTAIASWTAPTAADNCSVSTFTSDYNPGDVFTVGTTTVTYTATDAAGNSVSASFDITVTNDFGAANVVSTDVSCNGGSDGTIDLTLAGGTTPYDVVWNGTINSEDLTGLTAGMYTGVATDANGCTDGGTVTINEPTAIVINVDATTDPSNCGMNDGGAAVTVTGGTVTSAYTYSWSDGASYTSTVEDPTDFVAGSYTLTVTDDNSCTAATTVSVVDPNGPTVTLNAASVINLNCNGDLGDIEIDVTLNGTATSATYLWDDMSGSTTEDITGVSGGTYTLTVTDNNNCVGTISVNVTEPAAIAITDAVTNVDCNGNQNGGIDITVTGGVAPYTYSWVDPNNFSSSNEDPSGLNGGSYTVTVTDDNGCTGSATVSVTEPSLLTASGVGSDEMQGNDGSINLIVTGGSAPYTYSWTGPNGFTSAMEDPTGLVAGTYDVTVTDANGCTTTTQVTISSQVGISVNEQVKLKIYPNPTRNMVNVQLSVSDNYNVNITNSVGQVVYTANINASQTTIDLSGFERGIYFLSVQNQKEKWVQRVVLIN